MNEIKTKQLGDVWIASDGQHSAIGITEKDAKDAVSYMSWSNNANTGVECALARRRVVAGDAFKEHDSPFHPPCPACGSRNTMMIQGGDFQCLDCHFLWNAKLLDNL